ncbi:protoporphyrinogen oxidase [Sunxiuqinia sp. A32]|uniref:protoporphyrinogen oxidase n=1 Tax=Sunxiuqinia sp. A32 TaxID=3461496 RepID=UPI00404652BB
MKTKVGIIGAGLTGLTTAYYLKKKGIDVQLFEKADRAGGVIESVQKDGFLYEKGPNSGVLGQPEVMALVEDLGDAVKLEIADASAKFRWVWKGDRWHALPSGLIGGVTTPLFKFSDKLRLLGEPFRKAGNNPNETLADLVLRRMGRSFLNYAVDPFVLGIYSGDPNQLIPRFALPKLYNLEQKYGSFIGGSIKKAKEPKSDRDKKATREIFAFQGGLGSLIGALINGIGKEHIQLNAKDIKVEKSSYGKYLVSYTNGKSQEFDKLVFTAGAYQLKEIFPFIAEELAEKVQAMQFAKVIHISLGFKKWEGIDLKAFGGLVPFIEKRDVLGVLFMSSIFKGRAPEGGALLSTFLGGIRRPEMVDISDDEVKKVVEREMKSMMGLTKWDPDLLVINRYQHAIPQYGIESEGKLKAIQEIEAQFPGLIIAGNVRDGIGMADRIKQGKTLADSIN